LNIALVGMPGSGKSTVGRQLARRLQLPFIDADQWVEEQLGCSIREYFEREGEASFRDVEAQAIADIARGGPSVLATGGGAVLRPANRVCLREHTRVFYLFATPEEVYRRLRHDQNRPLLQVADPLARLRELYAQRDALYRNTAHDVITIGRPSTASLVNTIAGLLQPPATPV
jgi:shikimate kinase